MKVTLFPYVNDERKKILQASQDKKVHDTYFQSPNQKQY